MKKSMAFASMILLSVSAVAQAQAIKNWSAPSTWTQPAAQAAGGRTALVATTYPPLPFIPVVPCRVVDTRFGSGFPSGYGPPSLAGGGAQRSFTITGQCGVPAGAQAVSFNFAVWAPTSRGDLRVFPAGGGTPTVSTLNWEANILALANAAVTPLGAGGAITVQMDATAALTDIFVDINGYYSQSPSSSSNTFVINGGTSNGGYFTTTGGGEALIGSCLTASNDCYAVFGSAPTGDFSGFFDGGRGIYSISSDAGFPAVRGLSTNSSAAIFTTSLTLGDNGGVVGYDGTGVTGPGNLNGVAGVYGFGRSGVAGVTSSSGEWGVIGMKLTNPTTLGAFGVLGYSTYGMFSFGDTGASGTKSFVEPHPTDASKVIRYVSLEGNESGTYFRGTAQIINGEAVIPVPEDFSIVTDVAGLTVQVTPVGAPAVVWVASEGLDQIVLNSRTDVKVHYLVQGVRKAYKDFQVIAPGQEFQPLSADSTIPSYLSAEAKSRLIQNGTYNRDGTVNMATAERLGWAEAWRVQAKAAAAQPAVVTGRKP